MKSLLIMRHAKSDGSAPGQDDFDRVLNRRGRSDLPRMGQALAAGPQPGLVLASPAARARETTEGITGFLATPRIHFDERLYLAPPDTLHQVLAAQAGPAETVLVVAHNPGLEAWIGELSGARVALPTAAVACIDFGTSDWTRIHRGAGQLRYYLIPRLLKAMEKQS